MVVLLLVLAVADRAGAALAGRALSDELRRNGGLGPGPAVTVQGVPFLTQAVRGRYRSIDVTARDVDAGDVRLRALRATLSGAHVPLSDALFREVTSVPVEEVDASALVAYAELGRRSDATALTVSPDGDRVRLEGEVRVLGQDLRATALSRLTVDDGDIVVEAESFDVGSDTVGTLLRPALRAVFDQRLDLSGLPYGLVVEAVQVRPDGLAISATARDTVLTTTTG